MSNSISIEQFIESFISAVDFQDKVEITPDSILNELPEWDSLAALGVIVMFDVEFNTSIDGENIKNSKTINDLFQLLQ